jgi:tRNA-dihydrouridine synthase
MVGRAAEGNPWIFREMLGGPAPSAAERAAMVRRHLDEHLAPFTDRRAGIRAFRRMLLFYARGLRGAAQFRATVTAHEDAAVVFELAERFFREAEADPGASNAVEDEDVGAALG